VETNNEIKVYKYRWVVLLILFALNVVMQIHYLAFASITGEAAKYYGVSDLQINYIALSFMLIYVIISLPTAYILNRFGLRKGLSIGAGILGAFALLKGFYAESYSMVLFSSVLIAFAQPLIGNAATRVSAVWFPVAKRGVITSVIFLSQFIGMLLALAVTPFIVARYEIKGMMMIYGVITFVVTLIFMVFIREKPPTPPSLEDDNMRVNTLEGIKYFLKSRSGMIILFTFFCGMGIFNAIATCLEQILRSRSFDYNTIGLLGGLMLFAGIFGAFIVSSLSDKVGKRKPYIIAGSLFIIPSLLLIGFATNHTVVMVACLIFGFSLLGIGPLGFQYAAEISVPAPETVSQSILQLSGQLAGLVFVLGMNVFGDNIKLAIIIFAAMVFVAILLQTRMKESLVNSQTVNDPNSK